MRTDKKILNLNQPGYPKNISKIISQHKKNSQKIVMVTGCFDLLHCGHLIFLNFAKKQGNILIIGLGADSTIKKLKGKNRPIMNQKLRARVIAGLEIVDYVIINKEKLVNYNIDFSCLVAKIKPDVFVVPRIDKKLNYKKKLIEKYGGRLIACRRLPPNHLKGGISSTQILEKIKKL